MKWLLGIFLIGLMACTPDVAPIPADVLPSSKFASVMADIQLVEAAKTQNPHRRDWSDASIQGAYNEVFEKHGTTDSIFRMSFAFYQTRLDLLKPIYEEVLDSLNARDAELKKTIAKEYQVEDSLPDAKLQMIDSLKGILKSG